MALIQCTPELLEHLLFPGKDIKINGIELGVKDQIIYMQVSGPEIPASCSELMLDYEQVDICGLTNAIRIANMKFN